MRPPRPLLVLGVVLGMLITACQPNTTNDPAGADPTTGATPDATASQPTDTSSAALGETSTGPTQQDPPNPGCDAGGGQTWTVEESVTLSAIGTKDGLRVYAAEYPLPGPTDGLWSQWGQGVAMSDGRHLSAVGDHLGADGNSWFFLYNDADRSLSRVFDVQSIVGHQPGAWGYGKVHAQMAVDECGRAWAATYWGKRRDIVYGNGYDGDRLLEIDLASSTVKDHGAIAGQRGIPAMTISSDGYTLVAVAVDPEKTNPVIASFDTRTDTALEELDDPRLAGQRAFAINQTGEVLYSIGSGELAAFDPHQQDGYDTTASMPGDWLRAATDLTSEGTSYGVTQDQPGLFMLAANGSTTSLGEPAGYTTSLTLSRDGSSLFWLPNAHGSAWQAGAAVLQMDTATGAISELVSLGEMIEGELGLRAGGTYSIVYDDGRLILGINASSLDDDSGFGTVVLVVIEGL